MPQPLRVLIVEDSEEDATLLLQELRAGGYVPISERVETAEAMKAALHEQSWDLVISDYVMPGFGGLEALKLLQESGLDLPFILTSGKIGEMTAVEAMKAGVHDYVLKYNLTRLVPAIQRALQEAAARRENKQAEEVLRESEERYRNLIESSHDLIQSVAPDGRFLYVNRVWMDTLGYSQEELPRLSLFDLIHPDFHAHCQTMFQRIMSGEQIDHIAVAYVAKDGRVISLEGNAIPRLMGGKVMATQSFFRDRTEQKQAEEETRRRSDTQAVINSLLRRSLENVPPDELLGYALDLVLSIPWLSFQSRGCIFLVEEDPEALVMKAQNGLAKPIQKACSRVPFGRCLCGLAASTKEVQFADRLDERHDITYEGFFPHGHYCVPILSAGRVRGVMNLYLKEGHRREAKEEEFLQAVANTLAGIIERKQAEEALRESEEKYRHLVERSNDGITIIQDGIVKYGNRSLARMRGGTIEEIVGTPFTDFLHPEEVPKVVDYYKRRMAGEDVTPVYETCLKDKDGNNIYAELNASMLTYQGKPSDLVMVRDLTDRRRAEEALRDSEERYRTLFHESRDAIYINTPEGRFVDINQAGLDLFGYSREEILSLDIQELYVDPNERPKYIEEIQRRGFVRDYEVTFRRKDGRQIDVQITGVLSRDEAGRPQQYRGIIRDITARKWAEEALRQSEERYRAVVEQSPDAIYLVDRETKSVLEANIAFAHLLGYPLDELIGMSVYDFIGTDREEIDRALLGMLEKGSLLVERQLRRKDGSLVDVWISAKIITYGDKRVNCTVARDLTEIRRAGKALRESEERYRTIIEQSADGIYLVDVDTECIIEANRALAQMLGYTQEEMQGMHNYLLVESAPENIERRFQEILTSPSPLSFERRFRKKDGSPLEIWITAGVLSFGGKRVACGIIKDLTERKRAEREREQLINELQEALANIKTLSGLIPICAQCKKIRDDKGYWQQVEVYVREHSEAKFSHGLCPECTKLLFPGLQQERKGDNPI